MHPARAGIARPLRGGGAPHPRGPAGAGGRGRRGRAPAGRATLPDDALLVVLDSYTAIFSDETELASLRAASADVGRHREVAWASLDPLWPLGPDGSTSVQGISLPPGTAPADHRDGVAAVLGLLRNRPGSPAQGRVLARAHPSGTWLEWLDARTPAPEPESMPPW